MNDTLKRRLVGLLVLLVLVFVLSWLLPDNWPESGEKGVPSTTLPLAVNPLDGSSSGAAQSAAVPADAATAVAQNTPAAANSAAPARASALPESVDSVDSSAPPLPSASTPAAAAPPKPVTAVAPIPRAATVPPDIKPAPKPPAPKLAQVQPPAAKLPPPVAAAPPVAPKPVPPPVPAAPKVAAVVPPPPVVSSAATQAKLWFVQIGSFADQGNAQTTLNLLQNIGYRGESTSITNASGTALYRVRLGPFPSEAVAQQAFDKVSHQGYPQARVVGEAGGKH